jgi:hypothetical protein
VIGDWEKYNNYPLAITHYLLPKKYHNQKMNKLSDEDYPEPINGYI